MQDLAAEKVIRLTVEFASRTGQGRIACILDPEPTMAAGPQSVFDILSASPNARRGAALDLGSGRSAALWRNSRDQVTYGGAGGYTFSLYLEGGHGTRRIDGRVATGWPGALCIMPEGCRSEWEIVAPFAFAHLYVPSDELARAFAEQFDRDARLLDLAEATFVEAPHPAAALRDMARAAAVGDPLAAEAAAVEAVARLLADPRRDGRRPRALKGGLAPHLMRRVVEHVEAHLDGPVRLGDLAAIAGLSPFHFQRAFRASRGLSPHAFVARHRIERARGLLRGSDPVAAVALACGFSSQSHLTRAFRDATGITPVVYRRHASK